MKRKSLSAEAQSPNVPEGLDTVICDNVSGGQRQTISTARAILSRRPLLILDEPFSALDTDKEERLIALLRRESKKRIILISSHREDVFKKLDAKCIYLKHCGTNALL